MKKVLTVIISAIGFGLIAGLVFVGLVLFSTKVGILKNNTIVQGIESVEKNSLEETTAKVIEESKPSSGVNRSNNYDDLTDLIKEYELPEGSLYLSDNYGQSDLTKDTLISHSVCIWEPDYPPIANEKPGQNKIVVTIVPSKVKSRPDDLDLNLREIQEGDLHAYLPEDAEILTQTKSDKDTGTVKIRIERNSIHLVEYIRQNTIYCIKGYVSKATRFGCCSSFEVLV